MRLWALTCVRKRSEGLLYFASTCGGRGLLYSNWGLYLKSDLKNLAFSFSTLDGFMAVRMHSFLIEFSPLRAVESTLESCGSFVPAGQLFLGLGMGHGDRRMALPSTVMLFVCLELLVEKQENTDWACLVSLQPKASPLIVRGARVGRDLSRCVAVETLFGDL